MRSKFQFGLVLLALPILLAPQANESDDTNRNNQGAQKKKSETEPGSKKRGREEKNDSEDLKRHKIESALQNHTNELKNYVQPKDEVAISVKLQDGTDLFVSKSDLEGTERYLYPHFRSAYPNAPEEQIVQAVKKQAEAYIVQSEISKRVLNLECADAEKDPRLKNLKDKMTEAAVFQAQYEHFYPQLTIAKMSEQERASFVDDTLKEQGKLNEAGRGIYELRIVAFRDASKAKARVKNCGHNAQVFDTLASKANYDCEDEFNVAHAEYTKEQGLESRGPLLKQGKIVSFLRNAEKAEVAHDSLPMPESFWNELSRNRIQAGKVYVIEVSLGRANYTLVVKVIQVKEYAFTDAQVVNKLYAKCRERLNEIVLDLYKNAKIDDVNQSAKQ